MRRFLGLALTNAWMYGLLFGATCAALLLFLPWLLIARLRGRSGAAAAREGIWLYGRFCTAAAAPAIAVAMANPDAVLGRAPTIIVANHQSMYDIYLMGAQDAKNVCMLVRAWPFRKLFFFRSLMRLAGYIESEGGSPEAVLDHCRRRLGEGNHLLGFPEGTRSPDGALGRFHSGLFKIATDTGTAVTPLVIHNSREVMPKGSRLFRPGTVRAEFLPPLDPAAFAGELIPHVAMRRRVRALIAERLERFRKP